MKVLRFWTSHWNHDCTWWLSNFNLDAKRFRFVFDSENPDYLIVNDHVFTDNLAWKRFKRLNDSRRLCIFYSIEGVAPDLNIFDYAVVCDDMLTCGDRVVRRHPIHLWAELFPEMNSRGPFDSRVELAAKTGFCNFIYSNALAHPHREELFDALNSYKKVDSLGGHRNNVGNLPSRARLNWGELSVAMKRPYKFSIACENTRLSGYVTEKIVSSFLARTIPIYWGSPNCKQDFNPRAFIDANQMTLEEVVESVRIIDSDDDMWMQMVSEPIMTEMQCKAATKQLEDYRRFTENVFSLPLKDAKRVPDGFQTDNYFRFIKQAKGVPLSWKERLFAALGRDTELVDCILKFARRKNCRPRALA